MQSIPLYQRALDLGITCFHFAVDSNTRRLLAPDPHNLTAMAALRPRRNDLVITYMTVRRDTPEMITEDLDEFLRISGFGHVDVWYLCCPTPEHWDTFQEVFASARKAGKARFAAISTHRLPEDMERLLAPASPVDVVMVTYNFTSSAEDRERVDLLHHAGLGIVPMKPLAGRFYERTSDRPDAALRWLAADPRVGSIPVLMEGVEQVEQNSAAVAIPFSEQDRIGLSAEMKRTGPRFCRMCGSCDGQCKNGLAVSDLVRAAMYLEGYGDSERARACLDALPSQARGISCGICEQCSVRCPNDVAIKDRIRAVERLWC